MPATGQQAAADAHRLRMIKDPAQQLTVEALRAFIHEYRWSFPIGMDAPAGRGAPSRTMTRYGLRGTPSCLVLDRQGRVRLRHFGRMDDLVLGALSGRLISIPDEPVDGDETKAVHAPLVARSEATVCEPAGCRTNAGAWQALMSGSR